jgi:Flp pilus assembly CpaF family ATPase
MNAYQGDASAMNSYQPVGADGEELGGARMNAFQPLPPGLSNAPELQQGTPGTPGGSAPLPYPGTTQVASAQAAAAAHYEQAGGLTSDQVINGDPDAYTHLDGIVTEVTAWVQSALVQENRSDAIDEARRDPAAREAIAQEIDRLALQYMLRERRVRGDEGRAVVASVVNDIVGLGPLEPLWQDPEITEVIVNGPNDVYVERAGRLMKAKACRFRSQDHLLDVCQRILIPLNRKVDVRDPLADGRLPDGSRVNVVHQALAPKGPLLTIRRFPESNRSLIDLVNMGSMDKDMATLIATLIANKASVLVCGGTGSGKLLPLPTPIPTPAGWTTMGALQVGDQVLSRDGAPCHVTFVSAIDPAPDLYRLTLSDGQQIIADADHQWVVCDRADSDAFTTGEQVITTGEMLRRGPVRAGGDARFAIRIASALNLPDTALPIAPAMTGAALGDRVAHAGAVMTGVDEEIATIVTVAAAGKRGMRIPPAYLRASFPQRLALLTGLMDTAGTITGDGTCTIDLPHGGLADDVLSLARSLGMQARTQAHPASPARVTFVTALPVFTDPVRGGLLPVTVPDEACWLHIAAIDPALTEPGRCIQVDSPDSTYLAEDFIPTHNTTLLNALSAAIPLHERVVTIEDSLELRLNPASHVAAMEARPSDSSGKNSVTIRSLVKNSLRMRPDRIIVGEIRDSAALDMLQACNTGHEGSMSTVHANGPDEAISRLTVMVAQGGEIPADKVNWLIGSAIDIVVMSRRYEDGSRRVSGLYEVPDMSSLKEGQALLTIPLWEWEQTGVSDDGRLLGEYRKRNDVSEHLAKAKHLAFGRVYTWDDLVVLCGGTPDPAALANPTAGESAPPVPPGPARPALQRPMPTGGG